nr:rhomboid family intramembrane serine protease [uncultured Tessaracoccus sp.]
MTTPHRKEPNLLAQGLVVNGGLVALMWVLEAIDQVTWHSLDQYGVSPRRASELGDIFLAPWLHIGWGHLISNSVPFLVLGVLIYLSGSMRYLVTLLVTIVVSGLTVWLISPPYSQTLGASGIVFGFLTYLLVRGLFTRSVSQILLSIVVFAVYGGVLWGVLPTQVGVSWQAHLGGAVGGVLAAWLMHARRGREQAGKAQWTA